MYQTDIFNRGILYMLKGYAMRLIWWRISLSSLKKMCEYSLQLCNHLKSKFLLVKILNVFNTSLLCERNIGGWWKGCTFSLGYTFSSAWACQQKVTYVSKKWGYLRVVMPCCNYSWQKKQLPLQECLLVCQRLTFCSAENHSVPSKKLISLLESDFIE